MRENNIKQLVKICYFWLDTIVIIIRHHPAVCRNLPHRDSVTDTADDAIHNSLRVFGSFVRRTYHTLILCLRLSHPSQSQVALCGSMCVCIFGANEYFCVWIWKVIYFQFMYIYRSMWLLCMRPFASCDSNSNASLRQTKVQFKFR